MRELVLTPKFKRAFKRFVGQNRRLQQQVEQTLEDMTVEVFAPHLGTHKLSGNLVGLRGCSCGYDCRIIFSIEKDKMTGNEVIVLLDIGTHDEVY